MIDDFFIATCVTDISKIWPSSTEIWPSDKVDPSYKQKATRPDKLEFDDSAIRFILSRGWGSQDA